PTKSRHPHPDVRQKRTRRDTMPGPHGVGQGSTVNGTCLSAASRSVWNRSHRSVSVIDAVVVAGVAAGIGLRAWVLSATSLGSIDSDEAVWGLMARDLLHGHWSTFFWGQNYGGSQEAILTAGVFGITGTGTLQLKLVPTALYAAAALL